MKPEGVPESWRDPTGWRPYPLQMSIPPDTRGISYWKWFHTVSFCDPVDLKLWLSVHGADAPKTTRK
jgi:hypothetical protein